MIVPAFPLLRFVLWTISCGRSTLSQSRGQRSTRECVTALLGRAQRALVCSIKAFDATYHITLRVWTLRTTQTPTKSAMRSSNSLRNPAVGTYAVIQLDVGATLQRLGDVDAALEPAKCLVYLCTVSS